MSRRTSRRPCVPGEMRAMVVVGIENTERRRDMTGPTMRGNGETAIVGESLANTRRRKGRTRERLRGIDGQPGSSTKG